MATNTRGVEANTEVPVRMRILKGGYIVSLYHCRCKKIERQTDRQTDREGIVSMMEEDQGWLHNAPVVIEHDNNRDHRDTAIKHSKHTTYNITPTYSHIHISTYRNKPVPTSPPGHWH